MAWRNDVKRFEVTVLTESQIVHDGATAKALAIIKFGSPLTGSPGQPVKTGALRDSWQKEEVAPGNSRVFTDSPYARPIEDGMMWARTGQVTGRTQQRLTLRSKVGGFHSLKLLILGWPKVVADIVDKLGTRPNRSGATTGGQT